MVYAGDHDVCRCRDHGWKSGCVSSNRHPGGTAGCLVQLAAGTLIRGSCHEAGNVVGPRDADTTGGCSLGYVTAVWLAPLLLDSVLGSTGGLLTLVMVSGLHLTSDWSPAPDFRLGSSVSVLLTDLLLVSLAAGRLVLSSADLLLR